MPRSALAPNPRKATQHTSPTSRQNQQATAVATLMLHTRSPLSESVRPGAETLVLGLEAKRYQVRSGDVFVVRGNGSKDLVGRAGMIEEVDGHVIFPDLFIIVPLDPERILAEYFVCVWNSGTVRDRIEDLAKT